MELLSYLAEVTARGMALAAMALAAAWVLRVKSAAARHAALTAAMLGMLALAALTAALPAIPLRVLPAVRTEAVVPAAVVWADSALPAVAPPLEPAALPPRKRAWLASLGWADASALVYGAVALGMLLRLAYGYWFARKLARKSRAIQDLPFTCESPCITVPMTVGWLRPRILLPAAWKEWAPAKLKAVLAHERMHVARADWPIMALAAVNRSAFWFNPLAWWMERKLASLAEQACDDGAVLETGARESYAEALLEMAAAVRTDSGRMVWEAMAMAQTAEVRKRIERILDDSREIPRGMTRARWAALAACSLPLLYVTVAAQLAPAQAPPVAATPLLTEIQVEAHAAPAAATPLLTEVQVEAHAVPVAAPAAQSTIAPARPGEIKYKDKRLLVLYFDLAGMPLDGQVRAQNAAQTFLDSQAAPSDLVAVMTYTGQLKVVQDFTDDRGVLDQAIRTLPVGAVQASASPSADDTQFAPGATEFNIFNTDRQLSALQSAVKMLETLPEKKALVYFGGGITRNGIGNDVQLRATINAALQANVAFFPVDAQGNVAGTPATAAGAPAQFKTEIGEEVVRASHEAPYPYRLSKAVEPLHKVDPVYPPEATAAGIQGTVLCTVVIGTDGRVKDAEVLRGNAILAPAAREAVSQYVYEPVKAPNGEQAEVETMVTVPFWLNGPPQSVMDEIRVLTQNYQALYGRRAADSGGDHPAQVLSKVEPEYPYAQRARGYQGTVTLEVTVGVDGVPKEIRVVRSDPAFDAAVITAVRQWRFTPARKDGQPVESTVTLPISFQLE